MTSSARGNAPLRVREHALLSMLALGCACIIPDTQIQVQPERNNPGTVRIVQAVAVSSEANTACAEEPGFQECPRPPNTVVPGLIELEDQAFCVCEGGDANALGNFDIFVEDPDVDAEGEPQDALFGTLLLDYVPPAVGSTEETPVSQFVAYTNYLPPNRPAQLAVAGEYEQPIDRPPTNLRAWTLGIETGVDLCNDNNGEQLDAGLHSLRLVVTDRPWPLPVAIDEDGAPDRDGDEFIRIETADPLVGVPDIAAGASFDVADFVFRCIDETTEEGANACNCQEVQ